MRNSQKFVPPLRTNTRITQAEPDSKKKAPKCRRLYSDPADSIFSSTPVDLPTERHTLHPLVTLVSHEKTTPGESSLVRRQHKKRRPTSSSSASAVSSARSLSDQRSLSGGTGEYLTDNDHQTGDVTHEVHRLMTSEPLPAVRDHLVHLTPHDCASIFNFTPSPPPKRKAVSVSEKRKVCLDVLLTIYKMKNQLQVLRERRERLAVKYKTRQLPEPRLCEEE